LNEFVNKELLPEMKKIFPKSSIKKEIIGEIIGFNKVSKSEACEFISNLTGDNSREVVSFGTEAGLFQKIGISTVVCGPGSIEQAHKVDEFIVLDQIKKCLILLEDIKNNSTEN
jgi:acetylornithine deacetylase